MALDSRQHLVFAPYLENEWTEFTNLERFPLPLGAWDGLRYFIVALPEPSI